MKQRFLVLAVLQLALGACGSSHTPPAGGAPQAAPRPPAAVDAARLAAADTEPGNWMAPGRTYGEQHYSPLAQIDAGNVNQLGLAWSFDLDTAHRGQEATPLVIDGVMYVTSAWSKVFALDARTGALLWVYDPKVPGKAAVNACCDVVNRGAAAWKGRIYSGTLDGRLLALDAATGKLVWQVMTVPEGGRYTITGAPRVVKGMVLIGNGGAEMGMRGYVTAYDADTGRQIWRFYTVPGDPAKPYESAALEKAAKTWQGGEYWKYGGGGPVWDAIVYDPTLDMVYIGVGNGAPWNRRNIGGDALYLSSIVALKADTGEYVWHYQTTPHDEWDFDSCSPLLLADLTIGGVARAVIMQAPKNGFFYVLDRATGELLSAEPYTTTTWATSVDRKTGPVLAAGADYGEAGKPFVSSPGPGGGHSWQPMSYSRQTHLVYFPVTEMAFPMIPDPHPVHRELAWNTGVDFNAGSLPQVPKIKAQLLAGLKGHLVAWDPATQKEVWRVELGHPWNGGALSTAGDLVFQGTAMGEFVAYSADQGARLWAAPTQAGVLAAPVTYTVGGEQYVAVEVGWGGAFGLAAGELALKSHIASNLPRILVYKLGGKASLPDLPAVVPAVLDPPPDTASVADVSAGKLLYHTFCSNCHGDSATSSGVIPDLRYSPVIKDAKAMEVIVREGSLQANGMVAFKDEVSEQDLEKIRDYLIHRANEDKLAVSAAARSAATAH